MFVNRPACLSRASPRLVRETKRPREGAFASKKQPWIPWNEYRGGVLNGGTPYEGTVMYSARVTFLGLFTSLAVLPIGWSASASTFQYEGYTVANAQVIQVQAPNNIALEIGQITLHGAGVDAGQSIAVWCLDIFNLLTTSATFNVGPLTTAGAGGSNPTLSAAQISEIGSLMMHGNALINSNTDVSAATPALSRACTH